MVKVEHRQQAVVWLKQAYETLGCPELLERTELIWETSMKGKVGSALYIPGENRGYIKLSVDLWPSIPEFERKDTVVHEACHVADGYLGKTQRGYRKTGKHGPSWKKLMAVCGLVPREKLDARESLQLAKRVPKSCTCAQRPIPKHLLLFMQAGHVLTCNHCKLPIQLK